MGIDVRIDETFRELTQINVRHAVTETHVLLKYDLFSFWCADSDGVSSDAEALQSTST